METATAGSDKDKSGLIAQFGLQETAPDGAEGVRFLWGQGAVGNPFEAR